MIEEGREEIGKLVRPGLGDDSRSSSGDDTNLRLARFLSLHKQLTRCSSRSLAAMLNGSRVFGTG